MNAWKISTNASSLLQMIHKTHISLNIQIYKGLPRVREIWGQSSYHWANHLWSIYSNETTGEEDINHLFHLHHVNHVHGSRKQTGPHGTIASKRPRQQIVTGSVLHEQCINRFMEECRWEEFYLYQMKSSQNRVSNGRGLEQAPASAAPVDEVYKEVKSSKQRCKVMWEMQHNKLRFRSKWDKMTR